MPSNPDRFQLACWVHQVGRRQAAEQLAAGVRADQALAALPPPRIDPVRLARRCAQNDIEILVPGDAAFPALLRQIPDPPLLLYAQGDARLLAGPAVAVVGARRCTRLGAEIAGALAGDLAAAGVLVISGLARGIDGAAHRGALSRGRTAAVLGGGLERPYPSEHASLARAIVAGGGALLSEYLPWATPRPYHFPERNRVISGLVSAVVVVEAGEHSGSLITARMALEQGREVLAVPGPVTSDVSRGCHRLLRQGAALAETAADVLEAVGWQVAPVPGAAEGDATQAPAVEARMAAVLAAVEPAGTAFDDLLRQTGLDAADAAAALVDLELAGFVRQVPGGYIRRPSR